jgi:hypothetical protein
VELVVEAEDLARVHEAQPQHCTESESMTMSGWLPITPSDWTGYASALS